MSDERTEVIVALKQNIRLRLHMAAAENLIDGDDALAILMCLAAEMVAKIQDDDKCAEFTAAVASSFPDHVMMMRERPVEATLQ